MDKKEIYDLKELFEAVQLNGVLEDGKTFVDCIPKSGLEEIEKKTVENILLLLILACLVLLFIGFISPKISLFWYKDERTRKQSAKIFGLFILIFLILFLIWITV